MIDGVDAFTRALHVATDAKARLGRLALVRAIACLHTEVALRPPVLTDWRCTFQASLDARREIGLEWQYESGRLSAAQEVL